MRKHEGNEMHTENGPEQKKLIPNSDMAPLLEAVAISKDFNRVGGGRPIRVLKNVDFRIQQGEFVAVVGPSGSGKSTLLYCLAGLEPPTSGVLRLFGQDVSRLGRNGLARLRRDQIGFVFQAYNLIPAIDVLDNVALPGWLAKSRGARRRAKEVLKRLGVEELSRSFPEHLSGGQQQRVAIARAVASNARVVFADEPTGALDSAAGAVVLDSLRNLVDHEGRSVVMVTHDLEAASIADRVVVMRDGKISAELNRPSSETILRELQASHPAGGAS